MPTSSSRFKPARLLDYSKSEIIKEIRRVILDECGGIVPDRDHFERLARVSHSTIAERFGTYREAIRQAGFPVHKQIPRPIFTAEQVKTNLHEVLERANGDCFTQDFYYKNGGAYCVEVVKARLGVRNWKGVLETIGAKKKPRIVHTVVSAYARRRNFLSKVTEIDLFREIDRVWRQKGRRPSCSEFNQASPLGIWLYQTRYGSWTKAVEAFCKANQILIQGLPRARATKEMLLSELRLVQLKRPGAVLTYDSYKANGGTHDSSLFRARFGSWTAAVNAVGGISGDQARYSKDELFDEMQRLWEQCGRQPTQKEMLKQGNIAPKCYARMFGSWTKAIYAFCVDRNDEPACTAIQESPRCDGDCIDQVKAEAPVSIANEEAEPRLIEHATGKTVSPRLRWRVFMRDNFTCKACGRGKAKHAGLEIEVDHIVAYANGGETELNNLQTLCKECNRGKSNL
jgi:hypothetical protein